MICRWKRICRYSFWKGGQRSQTLQPYVPTRLRSILSAPAISFSQAPALIILISTLLFELFVLWEKWC
ncbi:hypothetical protein ES071_13045 [Bacillus velezensis]|nr:hypothetical protein ES071_13045 [Bacillus velezensis]